jgi:hypothetical protein
VDFELDYSGNEEEMHLIFARTAYEGIGTPEKLNQAHKNVVTCFRGLL